MSDQLRKKIPVEEYDYQALMAALADYSRPRDKVTELLRKKTIIRVKKGLYLFGPDLRRRPYSRELLANLLYGPSCVSLDYALHYHGLIPERVETVTSVTTKRQKEFATPVGLFTYQTVPVGGFGIGMIRTELADGTAFLMASPEKALADKLRSTRGLAFTTQKEILSWLVESLRIDEGSLLALDPAMLEELAVAYGSRKVKLLAGVVKGLVRREGRADA